MQNNTENQTRIKRENFSKLGFIFSALGSAVGLGNIWGFPTYMYKNGGASFLIPYLIAVFICALPALILEINLGNLRRKNIINIFKDYYPRGGKFLGWFTTSYVWILTIFYAVLCSWALVGLIISFNPNWLQEEFFFNNKIFHKPVGEFTVSSFSDFGTLRWPLLLAFICIWVVNLVIMIGGIKKGIERANKILIPSLFLILITLAIFSLTLPGAHLGLKEIFTPKLSTLTNGSSWSDAFGLAFVTTSTGMGIIICFSAISPKKQDNANKSAIIASGVAFVGLFSGIIIYSMIGYMAYNKSITFNEVLKGQEGMGLVFNIFPNFFSIFNDIGFMYLGNILAILFFLSLIAAGLSSLISLSQAVLEPIELLLKNQNHRTVQWKKLLIFSSLAIPFSFFYSFSNIQNGVTTGLEMLITKIYQILIVLIEIIIICWLKKDTNNLIKHNNATSWIKLKKGFIFILSIVCPFALIFIINISIYYFFDEANKQKFNFWVIGVPIGIVLPLLITTCICYFSGWKNKIIFIIKQRRK